MILFEHLDFYIVDKPPGISTHSPDSGKTEGFAELCERLLGEKLWVVHRLDKETSGCLILARSKESAALWTKRFESKSVQKTYFFLSRHASQSVHFTVGGVIEKYKNRFVFTPAEKSPGIWESETHFEQIGEKGGFYFYKALPVTGKPHQIRLHAEHAGIPILGDEEHGDQREKRLFLHAQKLEFDESQIESPLPSFFERAAQDDDLIREVSASLDRLRFYFPRVPETNTWRILGEPSAIRVELLGDTMQVLNYSPQNLPASTLEKLRQITGARHFLERTMVDRGVPGPRQTNVSQESKDLNDRPIVLENGVNFELRFDHGQSSGLFLDQRLNRQRISEISRGKSVCNLFSYSCGFSVVAALAQASEVVSVDTSLAALEWGKKNFGLNKLDVDRFEFFTADSLFFLEACRRKGRRFDIVICDPPSFSRSRERFWKIETDLKKLLALCVCVLNPGGTLLFTTNHETMLQAKVERDLGLAAHKLNRRIRSLEAVRCDLDYDWPGTKAHLTGFWSVLL